MQSTWDIRPSTPDDLAAVDALLAASYPRLLKADYPASVLVTALPIISRARPELLACGSYYVAVDATGNIRGAGGWTVDRHRAGRAHVRHLVTDHRRLRQGIGRALMDHVLTQARAAGIRTLDCAATRTAVPFYATVGFVAEGELTIPLAPGIDFPAVQMRMSLT